MCPRGDGPHKAVVKCRGNPAGTLQAVLNPAVSKTGVKMTLDERQSVFTLIRTDTTHDLSQKAEKVCWRSRRSRYLYSKQNVKINYSLHKTHIKCYFLFLGNVIFLTTFLKFCATSAEY